MKRACIGTLALALAAAGLSARAEDYYWSGDVREGAWENPANWGKADSFPNAADAGAVVNNWGDGASGTATITVGGEYQYYWGTIGGPVAVTLKGNGPDVSSLAFGNTLYVNPTEPATFDNMRLIADGFPNLETGSCFVFTNHAECVINFSGGFSLYNPCAIELRDNARFVANCVVAMLKRDQVFIIDNSEFVSEKQLLLAYAGPSGEDAANGQKIEFYGTHPKLRLKYQMMSGVDGTEELLERKPEFVFHVPYEDYEAVPVATDGTEWHYRLNEAGKQGIKFTVDPHSPRFKRLEHTWEKLFSWPEGILTDLLVIDGQENSRVRLYWTYGNGGKDDLEHGDEELPTALWAEFIPSGYFVILR